MYWIQEKSKRDSVKDLRKGTEVTTYRDDPEGFELEGLENRAENIKEIFLARIDPAYLGW